MLHIFCNGFFKRFSDVFTSVLDVCCKRFNCFERMLQMFQLNVSKVDQMLHLPPLAFYCLARCLLFSMLVMFRRHGPAWGRATWVGWVVWALRNPSRRGVWHRRGKLRLDMDLRSDVRALAWRKLFRGKKSYLPSFPRTSDVWFFLSRTHECAAYEKKNF
jgi:hypothetical protein